MELMESGRKITLIYPFRDSLSKKFEDLGCEVWYFKHIELKHINNLAKKISTRVSNELLLLFFLLRKRINSEKVDYAIINSELLSFATQAIPSDIPVYTMVHSLSFKGTAISTRITFFLQELRKHKYIAVSDAVRESLRDAGVRGEVIMNYNGVDTNEFISGYDVSVPNKTSRRILSVLHPVPHKGAHYLIQALHHLLEHKVKFFCTVAGWNNKSADFSYKKQIENKIKSFGLQEYIFFADSQTDIRTLYQEADVLLHPSESESFGYALAEAMCYSLPVVAFKAGGISEVVEDGVTGLLVDPYDSVAMAASVRRLLEFPELRVSLGKKGREVACKKFDQKTNVAALLRKIEKD